MNKSFFVAGIPQSQGSTRAFVVKGRAVTTSDNPKNRSWRADVNAAMAACFGNLLLDNISVELAFVLPRPKSLPKTKTPAHTKKPDLDKLVRSVLDAGTGVVWPDDAAVDDIRATKRYAAIGEQSGVHISIHGAEMRQGVA